MRWKELSILLAMLFVAVGFAVVVVKYHHRDKVRLLIHHVQVDGRDLTCISARSDHGLAISCDWDASP